MKIFGSLKLCDFIKESKLDNVDSFHILEEGTKLFMKGQILEFIKNLD